MDPTRPHVARSVQRRNVQAAARPARASLSPYRVPAPYGEHSGTDAVTTVAAPLLAAASVTLAGVIIQQEDALRWPGVALLILTAAILLLVASVQCGAWARRYMTTPDQMLVWWPGANRARHQILEQEQKLYSRRLNVWSGLAALAFNTGLILLWAGLSVALVPGHHSAQPQLRWLASAVAAAGAAAEFVWIVTAQTAPYRRWRRATRR